MTLFNTGSHTLSSGKHSFFKIDCDCLSEEDWNSIALMLIHKLPPFREAEGVYEGGLKLARYLNEFNNDNIAKAKRETHPLLIVDDVLTTGSSMNKARQKHIDALPPGTLTEAGSWI